MEQQMKFSFDKCKVIRLRKKWLEVSSSYESDPEATVDSSLKNFNSVFSVKEANNILNKKKK